LARSASNSAAPNGVSMLAAVRSSKQVWASQHAPPPFRNTTSRSLRRVRFTPTPVGEPSPHVMPAIGTQVQVSSGASIGGPDESRGGSGS
jgi:hypothetical protein